MELTVQAQITNAWPDVGSSVVGSSAVGFSAVPGSAASFLRRFATMDIDGTPPAVEVSDATVC